MNRKYTYIFLILITIFGLFLRVYQIDKVPLGLNWDEANVGYNAYSLFKTGKDEYGKPWPLLIESFGDYKTGIYSWLLAPILSFADLNVKTIRLPNTIL